MFDKPSFLEPPKTSRRAVLKHLAAASVLAASGSNSLAQQSQVTLHVSDTPAGTMPEDFSGLSYESSQLSHPQFFAAANNDLVRLFRTLGTGQVLRLGGNTSEFTAWDLTASAPATAGESEGPDAGTGANRSYPVTPRAIDNLAGFLAATDWKLIYGLNLARGSTEAIIAEAKYVVAAAGSRLVALQLGNEPDLWKHDNGQRWTYEEFLARWKTCAEAVRAQLPDVPLAGPDGSSSGWNARFGRDAGLKLVLLTSHYYAEGPPTDPRMNLDLLMHPGERLQTYVMRAIDESRSSIPYRMTEGNTCYNAGKAGVSDTLASALWVVDLMLSIAQAGGTGVNLHGGGNGLYTPIAGSIEAGFQARPIFYGMLLVKQLLGSTLLKVTVDAAGRNIAAYACRKNGSLHIILVNRDPGRFTCNLFADLHPALEKGAVWRLAAPSIASTGGVTLANAMVSPEGGFRPKASQELSWRNNQGHLEVDGYSVVLLSSH